MATAPSPATRQLSLAQARTEMSERRARLSRAVMAKDRAAVADFFLPDVELVIVDTLRGRDAVLAYMDSLTRDARAFTLSLSREDDVGVCSSGESFERGVFTVIDTSGDVRAEVRGRFALLWSAREGEPLRIAKVRLSRGIVARRADFERCRARIGAGYNEQRTRLQVTTYLGPAIRNFGGGLEGLDARMRELGLDDDRLTYCDPFPSLECYFESTPVAHRPRRAPGIGGLVVRYRFAARAGVEGSALFGRNEDIAGHSYSQQHNVFIRRATGYYAASLTQAWTYLAVGGGPALASQRSEVLSGASTRGGAHTDSASMRTRRDASTLFGGSAFAELRFPVHERIVMDYRLQGWWMPDSPVPAAGRFPGATARNRTLSQGVGIGVRF